MIAAQHRDAVVPQADAPDIVDAARRRAAIVVLDELELLAEDAAGGVDLVHRHLGAHPDGFAAEGRRSRHRAGISDTGVRLGGIRRAGSQCDRGGEDRRSAERGTQCKFRHIASSLKNSVPSGNPLPRSQGRGAVAVRTAPLLAEAAPADGMFRAGKSACPANVLPRTAPDSE